MATGNLGTNANNSLTSLLASGNMSAIDLATIVDAIKDDINVAHPVMPTAWSQNNLLYVPNRGVLKVLPGDYIGVDSQGWPILVSANSIANAAWTHT
jgi:hypothetical protein